MNPFIVIYTKVQTKFKMQTSMWFKNISENKKDIHTINNNKTVKFNIAQLPKVHSQFLKCSQCFQCQSVWADNYVQEFSCLMALG